MMNTAIHACSMLVTLWGCVAWLSVTGCGRPATHTGGQTIGIVVGDSMAPTLKGSHRKLVCADCRFRYDVADAIETSQPEKLVCPNCGNVQPATIVADKGSPDEVYINELQAIRRWDVVAFRYPEGQSNGQEYGIKRVVGLPGEVLEIVDGNLFVSSSDSNPTQPIDFIGDPERPARMILRKSWPLQKRIRMLVFDSSYSPQSGVPPRLKPAQQPSNWHATGTTNRFHRDPSSRTRTDSADESEWDWLNYHHWRCCDHAGGRDQDHPVEDVDSFNVSLGRRLNPMDELFLELSVQPDAHAVWGWQFQHGDDTYRFTCDETSRQITVTHMNRLHQSDVWEVINFPSSAPTRRKRRTIECSSFDQRLIVVINGELVFARNLPQRSGAVAEYPLQIGGQSGALRLDRFRLWRDVYFLSTGREPNKLSAGPAGYIVLGDNVPVSVDSRHWASVSVPAESIIGPVELK